MSPSRVEKSKQKSLCMGNLIMLCVDPKDTSVYFSTLGHMALFASFATFDFTVPTATLSPGLGQNN